MPNRRVCLRSSILSVLLSSQLSCASEPEPCNGSACDVDAAVERRSDASDEPADPKRDATLSTQPTEPLSARIVAQGASRTCGDCAVIIAHAKGGVPPHEFTWGDAGLEGAGPHEICDREPTRYGVVVRDRSAPLIGDVTAPVVEVVSANVDLPCTVGEPDAGASFTGCKVLLNANVISALLGSDQTRADSVYSCLSFDGGAGLSAGASLDAGAQSIAGQYLALPQPMIAGHSYTFVFEQVLPLQLGGDLRMELWGTREGCSLDEKLGELSVVNGVASELCLRPQATYEKLLARPSAQSVNPLFAFSLGLSMTLCADCAGQ